MEIVSILTKFPKSISPEILNASVCMSLRKSYPSLPRLRQPLVLNLPFRARLPGERRPTHPESIWPKSIATCPNHTMHVIIAVFRLGRYLLYTASPYRFIVSGDRLWTGQISSRATKWKTSTTDGRASLTYLDFAIFVTMRFVLSSVHILTLNFVVCVASLVPCPDVALGSEKGAELVPVYPCSQVRGDIQINGISFFIGP
jgi:hypothetical protein